MAKHTRLRGIASVLLALLLIFTLVGCSQKKTTKTKYYDKDFISALETGLQNRWKITDSVKDVSKASKDILTKSVNAELNAVKTYKDKKFKNDKLHEQVITYLNALEDQKKALKSFDKSNFITTWNKAYNTRTEMILKINSKYKLKVAPKYEDDLTELTRNGDSVAKNDKKAAAIDEIIKTIKFKKTKDDGYNYTYDAKVKNTSNYSFKTFGIKVKLMDSSKTVVSTEPVFTDEWAKGQTNQFEFMTNKKFTSYKVIHDYVN